MAWLVPINSAPPSIAAPGARSWKLTTPPPTRLRDSSTVTSAPPCDRPAVAQEREDRTLLSTEQMNAIINEASGERAMHHVLQLVPYQFVRPPSEYQGHFRKAEVMATLAKEYGFANVTIEDYPTGQTWQPTVGELWMTTPRPEKIYDLNDIPEAVASTNGNADVTGELVSVG